MRKYIVSYILIFALTLLGCGSGTTNLPEPDKIVPGREILVENLEAAGYAITPLAAVEGSDLTVDRIVAEKGDRFIDIVYGLSAEEASAIFARFCERYPDDYYILARNGNYVYCVSDKKTFAKAGFTSTDNVGVQYIHN